MWDASLMNGLAWAHVGRGLHRRHARGVSRRRDPRRGGRAAAIAVPARAVAEKGGEPFRTRGQPDDGENDRAGIDAKSALVAWID